MGEGSLTHAVVHLEGNHRADDDDPRQEPPYRKRPATACKVQQQRKGKQVRWGLGERSRHRKNEEAIGGAARTCLREPRIRRRRTATRGEEEGAAGEEHARRGRTSEAGWSGTAGGDEWISLGRREGFIGMRPCHGSFGVDRSVPLFVWCV